MFTGIIEETGTISSLKRDNNSVKMEISAKKVLEDVKTGDSIAVNGICLTVVSFTRNSFTVDVMPETVKATSLNRLSNGSKVNLERAMQPTGRFGGHFVSGHIDGTGTISKIFDQGIAKVYKIICDTEILKYIIKKGSVALDGTSLTVLETDKEGFSVGIIPHTQEETILRFKKAGDIVNIECDLIGKYVEKFMFLQDKQHNSSKIDENFLKENGFF